MVDILARGGKQFFRNSSEFVLKSIDKNAFWAYCYDNITSVHHRRKQMLRNKAIPLYYQLETILRKKILSGEIQAGTALPSEGALAQEYEVSRITVRKALSILEGDELIVRRRGRGTFVLEQPASFEVPKFTGSIEDLISMGIKTSTKVLDFSLTRVAKNITDHLGLPEGTEVVRIERLRLAKVSPFSYILNYLPPTIGQKIRSDDLLTKPLLKILEDDLGIDLAEATQRIEADLADSYVAPLLEVPVGDPLLKIERTVFDSEHKAVEFVSVLYRADRYYYTAKLERKKSEKEACWSPI